MIYIAIPAHNEAATAGALLWKIRQVMGELARDYEILFLDDGSTDGTGEALKRYARALPLTVLRHETRRGYAASVEVLLRRAVSTSSYPKRDVAVVVQADFSEDPAWIAPLVKRIEGGADVVVAAAHDGQGVPRGLDWARRFCQWARARLRLPAGVSDPLSGFRAYRIVTLKRALEGTDEGAAVRTEGRASNVEWLSRVASFARRVDEEPALLRRDRLQRPPRFRTASLWRDLLRLWLAPPRRTEPDVVPAQPRPRTRDGARRYRGRGRRRRTG